MWIIRSMLGRLLGRRLGWEPRGFVLYRADGKRHNVIRGDLIPPDAIVVVTDGRHFVDTGKQADDFPGDWRLYREGHSTFEYRSMNS